MSSLRVLARTRSLYGGEDQLIFVPIPATLIFPAQKLPCLARLPTRPDGLLSGRRRSWPRSLLDRPSSHDALEILKRHPAAEFSGPNPNRRRPSQLDQLEVPVPAPDRHGGDAKLFLHLGIGDKRVVAGRVGSHLAAYGKAHREPKPDAFRKRLAADYALDLCERFGVKTTTARTGKFCLVAAALFGDPNVEPVSTAARGSAPWPGRPLVGDTALRGCRAD